MASAYDLRAWTTFDATSQKTLLAGGTVTGGDGRQFILLNGHATTVGSETYKTLMAQRQANAAAAAPQTTATAPVPSPLDGPFKRFIPDLGGRTGGSTSPDEEEDPDDAARDRDAKARIMSVLREYGLESLANFVWDAILQGKSDAEILQDIRNTPEFKTRFPAIDERVKRGLAPLSPGEYVAYEQQARQIMRAAGLPETFYDSTDDYTRFLSADVSIAELNDRIQLGRQAAFDAPAEVRQALMRDYGMTEGGLTAYFLDPDRALPILERQYRAGQIGGAGIRTGFGSTRAENERLAALGITAEQAQQGFGALGESRELFQSLDRGEDAIGRDEQLGAVFEGNSNAQRRIEQRRSRRRAVFQGGGGFASGQDGISGLGDTR